MIDTIHLWLSRESVSNANLLAEIPVLLDNPVEHKTEGSVSFTGYKKNLKIFVTYGGISVKGSIPKFYLGNNTSTLQRSDCQRAFESLCDKLHLPLNIAKITRIDLAQTYLMKYPPKSYYSYLGDCQYFQRWIYPKSILYRNSQRQMAFYDKIAETKTKGLLIPPIWTNQNTLRYEYRFTKAVAHSLKMGELIAEKLYDEMTYIKLINRYVNQYEAINKKQLVQLNPEMMNSPKDVHRQILALAYQKLGEDQAFDLVEDLRSRNAFSNKEYYSRLKKEIRELCLQPNISEPSELIKELDSKINMVKKNYR